MIKDSSFNALMVTFNVLFICITRDEGVILAPVREKNFFEKYGRERGHFGEVIPYIRDVMYSTSILFHGKRISHGLNSRSTQAMSLGFTRLAYKRYHRVNDLNWLRGLKLGEMRRLQRK
ncbi:hypothetical protein CO251_14795 [Sulfobacillus sp. hq2]|nr:hypothetical protein CO251_14795 [Sulfobacillus sp. hq2]